MTIEKRNEIIKRVEGAFKEIFNNVENGYAIYQLPIEVPYKFRDWEDVAEFKVFNKNDYNCLWATYNFDWTDNMTDMEILNNIYLKFNMPNRPNEDVNYYGTSLSVSDVIVIKRNSITTVYYVDNFGFKKVEDFI